MYYAIVTDPKSASSIVKISVKGLDSSTMIDSAKMYAQSVLNSRVYYIDVHILTLALLYSRKARFFHLSLFYNIYFDKSIYLLKEGCVMWCGLIPVKIDKIYAVQNYFDIPRVESSVVFRMVLPT